MLNYNYNYMTHPLFTNHLANEKSPYLQQHAHNPVDWYPWGDEAFTLAREQDKPIFLSIGYASCHWCHVMGEESFADSEIGRLMNETFVNVKVDREEKPEVDTLYMEFAQAMMSGGAGWPLCVILTPDMMPFFATTYLPPDAKHGFLGLKQLIFRIKEIWSSAEEREEVIEQAGKIVELFESHMQQEAIAPLSKEIIHECAELLFKTADPIYGGTRGSPKFPVGYQASFLLRFSKRTADSRALFYVERSLEMMRRGGIYDQLGGGFARYSIDERWMVPHFEKMLSDNAIIAKAYLETWLFTHQASYRVTTEHILRYLIREMQDSSGGFYSAEDSDTEHQEGRFYTWTWEEIHEVLSEEDASLFCEFFGVTPTGNFEGRSVLHMSYSIEEFSALGQADPEELKTKIENLKNQLFLEREKKVHPEKDKKIIASYNGLIIHLFAKCYLAFHNETYLEIAEKCALFIKEKLWNGEELFRRYFEGEAKFSGCLDDYAFVISGLLSLFEATGKTDWFEFALSLNNVLFSDFKAEKGAFYHNNGKDPNLLLRRFEFYDGAEPSGNAVQAENLVRIAQLTGAKEFLEAAGDILSAAKLHIEMYPPAACYHLMALQRLLDQEAPTLIVALNEEETNKEEIRKILSGHFIPHLALLWWKESDEGLRDLSPVVRDKKPIDGKTTLYLCRARGICEDPINDMKDMFQIINKL